MTGVSCEDCEKELADESDQRGFLWEIVGEIFGLTELWVW